MYIRQGTVDEMLSLWYKKYTSEFMADNINNNKAEFWTVELDNRLVGELYAFFELDDKDFADGKTTAYICAFRIVDEMQGKGLGTKLLLKVLERLSDLGYLYATIGVEPEEIANIKLYNKLGFTEKMKTLSFDPCDVDCEHKPAPCTEYYLLKKKLCADKNKVVCNI
jgi:ribosomal protein S18 acetylase RimI-like enzyme